MTAPIPTGQAVDLLAATMYAQAVRFTTAHDHTAWADLDPARKHSIRSAALELLVPVYPQIVADVLDAQALDWEDACADDVNAPCHCTEAIELRERADEVRP